MKKRFKLGTFAGRKFITDTTTDRVFGYGPGLDLPTEQQHRMYYTDADAQAVVDYLNSLAA